ncbi:MAG: aminotransferase class IV [Candidatus Omnitrophica bacterium]|nr:aminotransferase class IV [Candidatus Omnitrophota bacterium]
MTAQFFLYSGGKKVTDGMSLKKFETEEIGVFESLRTYHGQIFQEREHLDRLLESAKTVGFSRPVDRAQIRREVRLAIREFLREKRGRIISGHTQGQKGLPADLFIRITVWKDDVFVMIGERAHAAKICKAGVKLRTSSVPRSAIHAWPGEVKTTAYQNPLLAGLGPAAEEVFEWLLLDRNGYVTEVRVGNLFIVKGRTDHHRPCVLTPPTPGILNGVTRLFVIKCVLDAGMWVKEIPLTRYDVYTAEEAFLTNTSWEILPVRELDGRRIGDKIPGPATLELQQIFKERIDELCRSH